MIYPNTRKQALIEGSDFYLTGNPCVRGHVSKRRVKNKSCVECSLETANKQYWGNREDCLARNKKWMEENRDARAKYMAEYREKNSEKIKETSKEYYDKNKYSIYSKKKEYYKKWREDNRDHLNRYKKNYIREWSKTKEGKSIRFMRMSVYRTLKGYQKNGRTESILGYTRKDLVCHLEKQFTKNMSWDNYGAYWHIDHITPIQYFIDSGEYEISKVNCLSNLRPVCAKENMSKGENIEFLI